MEEVFSHRIGITKPKSIVQIDSMDDELRTAIWNTLVRCIWQRLIEMRSYTRAREPQSLYPVYKVFIDKIWTDFLKLRLDKAPLEVYSLPHEIEDKFFKWEWYKVYDFIDFIARIIPEKNVAKDFVENCNSILEKELSPYRFVGKYLMPHISNEEIKEVEKALAISSVFNEHLDRALEMLTDRKTPDYRNSIKESISSVEAVCQLIAEKPKATLGDALKKLNDKGEILHPALKDAFNRLYGYTSDADGIRHALQGKSDLDATDARFMLVICSAFINYLVSQAIKVGIEIKSFK